MSEFDQSSGSNLVASANLQLWLHLYVDSETTFTDPIVLDADIVHGFKRGSKELGIPTANLNMGRLGEKGETLATGIYFGWTILNGQYYETVTSVGWNPYFQNTKKTIEAHLLHQLDDFYGEEVRLILCGYLRPEANFKGVDELISCIQADIEKSKFHFSTDATKDKYLTYIISKL